jgi:hypothetical protein
MLSLSAKIGLGALGTFAVGMAAITAVREATEAVAGNLRRTVAETLGTTSLHAQDDPKSLAFVFEGQPVGSLTTLDLSRTAGGQPLQVRASVWLTDEHLASRLTDCDLMPVDADQINLEDGFRCAGAADADLTEIGSFRFEPAGFTRSLRVSRAALPGLSHGSAFHATADLNQQVDVSAHGDAGGRLDLQAGKGGASMNVTDEAGRAIMRLLADKNGAFIRVRDKNGREIVRLRADRQGLSFTVDKPDSN